MFQSAKHTFEYAKGGNPANPYVHSNIENINAINSVLNNNSELLENKKIQEYIRYLEYVRMKLYYAAEKFLGGESIESFSKRFREGDANKVDFAAIGRDTLNSPEIVYFIMTQRIYKIKQGARERVNELLSAAGVQSVEKFLQGLNSSTKFTNAILQNFTIRNNNININSKNSGSKITKGNLVNIIDDISKESKTELSKFLKEHITENMKKDNYEYTLSNGSVVGDAIYEIFKELFEINYDSLQNAFLKTFKSVFEKKVKDKTGIANIKDIDGCNEYINRVISALKDNDTLKNSLKKQAIANWYGDLGEPILQIVENSDYNNSTYFINTGSILESNLEGEAKKFFEDFKKTAQYGKMDEEARNRLSEYFTTGKVFAENRGFHDVQKQSQSDFVLINTRNGEVVRAQAKNLQASYQNMVSLVTGNKTEGQLFPGQAGLFGSEMLFADFWQRISKSSLGILKKEDWAKVSYLASNYAYLKEKKPLIAIKQMVDDIIGVEAVNLMGLDMGDSTANQDTIRAANVFYIVGNAVIEPAYQIIDDLISRLNGEVNQNLSKIQARMNYGDISYSDKQREEIWEEKRKAQSNEPGYRLGHDIYCKLKINGINMSFSWNKLMQELKSAYDTK